MNEIRDPQDRVRPARRRVPRWAPLPLGIGLGLAAGLGYGFTATPQYSASGYVVVVPEPGTDAPTALGFAQAYGRIATGSAVLAGAQAAGHTAASDLRAHVRAATSPDAPMIEVTGTSPRAGTAAKAANAVARSLAAVADRDSAATGVRLLLFSPAAAPTAPSSPSAGLAGAVGGCAGGLLGALTLLVRPRREDAGDAEVAGSPALAAATAGSEAARTVHAGPAGTSQAPAPADGVAGPDPAAPGLLPAPTAAAPERTTV